MLPSTNRSEGGFFLNIDWVTILIYALLVGIGWFNIYAATYDSSKQALINFSMNSGKQLIWIGTAGLLILIILLLDAKIFHFFSYTAFAISLLLLIGVLFFGETVSGNKGWYNFGLLKLQPAEFAKVTTCLALAKYLSAREAKSNQWKFVFVSLVLIGTPCLLILLQPDVGSTLIYSAFLLVLYREGLQPWVLIALGLLVLLFIMSLTLTELTLIISIGLSVVLAIYCVRKQGRKVVLVLILGFIAMALVAGVHHVFNTVFKQHHRDRIEVLLGKKTDLRGVGYNVNQSKIAIGAGGFSGKGYLKGTQTKFSFVPEQSTDFIFCTIGEEWGFLGSFTILFLFAALFFRIIRMAERQRSGFSRIYGYGVVAIFFCHVLVNIGMTVGLFPVIGVPLPFISYGGSSLWSFTILLFILIKLDSRHKAAV